MTSMSGRVLSLAVHVLLPLAAFGGYLLLPRLWPQSRELFLTRRGSELYNPAEWGTVLFFLIGSIVMLRLATRGRRWLPAPCTAFYIMFGIAGLLVVGEELSWGQHIFNFKAPAYFVERNEQRELNLHNFADSSPATFLRRVAIYSLPCILVLAPLGHMAFDRKAYTPGHWPFYVLPKLEAIVATLLAAAALIIGRAGWLEIIKRAELAELFWGMAICFWAVALQRRLGPHLRQLSIGHSGNASVPAGSAAQS
jgi:hypothetical protein